MSIFGNIMSEIVNLAAHAGDAEACGEWTPRPAELMQQNK
jgi:hypothetical protein